MNFNYERILQWHKQEDKPQVLLIFLPKYCIVHVVKQLEIYDFGEILPTNCFKQFFFNQKFSVWQLLRFP